MAGLVPAIHVLVCNNKEGVDARHKAGHDAEIISSKKNITPALQARFDAGVTTLCRCWIVTRNDGAVQGFTDHDEDIVVSGVTCRAATGLSASEATEKLGLAVNGSEIFGALADASITEADLAAGRYDAAAIEIWLVDWSEPSLKVRLSRGVLGEVRRAGNAFGAEVRGLAHRLNEESGRLFSATCSADLGDTRCTVDLNDPDFRGEGVIAAVTSASSFTASSLNGFDDGWFTAGRLVFTSGPNSGLAIEVKTHRKDLDGVTLDLWQAMPEPLGHGDAFVVTAGCDKRFDTCVAKFANAENFRGFPHMPGMDFVTSYPVEGEPGHDGKSLQA
jgi:uncharacterized phage protein (TIGR02218 family)